MALPPMISALSLGGMPEFMLQVLGSNALRQALYEAGLPPRFTDEREGYIPEQSLAKFIDRLDRDLGESNVGLLWANSLSVRDYGVWGDYVLSAPSLGAALRGAQRVMPFHSSVDRTTWRADVENLYYGYRFGLRHHAAYPAIAFSALGSMLSIFRHYLGDSFRPTCINCDFNPSARTDHAEEVFHCPVHWNTQNLEVGFSRQAYWQRQSDHGRVATMEDISRERNGYLPRSFSDVVVQVLRMKLDTDGISLDRIAESLDLGPRTVQRRLARENSSFRELVNRASIERAKELLNHGGFSVTTVAAELGYTSQSNFSRAFRNQVGLSPSEFALSRGTAVTAP